MKNGLQANIADPVRWLVFLSADSAEWKTFTVGSESMIALTENTASVRFLHASVAIVGFPEEFFDAVYLPDVVSGPTSSASNVRVSHKDYRCSAPHFVTACPIDIIDAFWMLYFFMSVSTAMPCAKQHNIWWPSLWRSHFHVYFRVLLRPNPHWRPRQWRVLCSHLCVGKCSRLLPRRVAMGSSVPVGRILWSLTPFYQYSRLSSTFLTGSPPFVGR